MVTAVVTFYSNKPPITERFRTAAQVVPADVYDGSSHRPRCRLKSVDFPATTNVPRICLTLI